jgi:hypothetical protein
MAKQPDLNDDEKIRELERYYKLVVAAINYLLENKKAMVKTAEYDSEIHFRSLIAEAQIHYEKGRLAKLKSWFRDFTEIPRETGDLNFNRYVYSTTGYKIDIFKSYFERIEKIIAKGKITTERQYYEADRMVDHLCQCDPVDTDKITVLNKLLSEYQP